MAKTITINVSDIDEKILYHYLQKDVDGNEGIKDWVDKETVGKINHTWELFRQEGIDKLMDDDSFTDVIPKAKADFVNLVTSRDDYKDRTARDAEAGG